MANNANESSNFQDLLKAALSESGISEDFEDLGNFQGGVSEDTHVPVRADALSSLQLTTPVPVIQTTRPAGQQQHQQPSSLETLLTTSGSAPVLNGQLLSSPQTSIIRNVSTVASPHGCRPAGAPKVTVLGGASGQRIAQALGGQLANTGGVRKIIVHTVKPSTSTGAGAPAAALSSPQFIRTQAVTAVAGGTGPGLGARPGAIKIIRITNPKASGGLAQSGMIRIPATNKPVRIVTVRPPAVQGVQQLTAAKGITTAGKSIILQTTKSSAVGAAAQFFQSSEGTGNVVTLKPGGQKFTIIRTPATCSATTNAALGAPALVTRTMPHAVQASTASPVVTYSQFIHSPQVSLSTPVSTSRASPGRTVLQQHQTFILGSPAQDSSLRDISSMRKGPSTTSVIPQTSSYGSPQAVSTTTSQLVSKSLVGAFPAVVNTTPRVSSATASHVVHASMSPGGAAKAASSVRVASTLALSGLGVAQSAPVAVAPVSVQVPTVTKTTTCSVVSAAKPVMLVSSQAAGEARGSVVSGSAPSLLISASQSHDISASVSGSTGVLAAASPPVDTSQVLPVITKEPDTPSTCPLAESQPDDEADGFDPFDIGGSDDGASFDIFSQALRQMADTNKKAAKFEAEVKQKQKDVPKPDSVSGSEAPVSIVMSQPGIIQQQQPSVLSSLAQIKPLSSLPTHMQHIVGDHVGSPINSSLGVAAASPLTGETSPVTILHPVTSQGRSLSPVSMLQQARPMAASPVSVLQQARSVAASQGRSLSPVSMLQQARSMAASPVSVLQQARSISPVGAGHPVASSAAYVRIINPSSPSVGARVMSHGQLQQLTSAGPQTPLNASILAGRRILPAGMRISVRPSPGGGPAQTLITAPSLSSINHENTGAASLDSVSGVTGPAGNGMMSMKLTDKDVSRLWANQDIKMKKITSAPNIKLGPASPVLTGAAVPLMAMNPHLEEEVEEEEEELGHAETYEDYMPSKLKLGQKHPDPVVETSSMSSVEAADIWYKMSIPEHIIDYGQLSALQLETIVYASQKHATFLANGERAGFLIGDGAGVGKGRTIAGIIYENYLQGRKRAVWLSVSNDLRVDAERDLGDIGAGKIEVYPLNKFKYAKISSHVNGSVKKGVVFCTYSSLIGESQSGGKYRTRFKQLLHWLGKDFDGCIVYDECHRAKNLCPVGSSKPTKTGLTVLELQNKLPKARIVYASATGASEPKNMAYMTRLGLWGLGTPFREFNDFIQAIEKRGVGAMELVAMDMKLRGIYMARQLSFQGTTFRIEEIPIPKQYIIIYNKAVQLWVSARDKFQRSADLVNAEQRMRKSMWGQFWSSHQRFFKYLCISAKVPYCVKLAREAVKNGKCVVIGLQSTGEARTLEQLEDMGGELTDFVSTAKGVFQTLVEKHFPAPDRRKTMDLFGIGSSLFDDSPQSSPKPGGHKRKRAAGGKNNTKKARRDWFLGSEDEDVSDGDSDNKPPSLPSSSSSDVSSSGSDSDKEDEAEEEEEEEEENDEDDFNPFGGGSDSDDDPWLKKAKKSNGKQKTVKKPKKKKKKKKKKKHTEKKEEKKKEKDKKPSKKTAAGDSDAEFDDIDKEFDKALAAAGIKAGKENSISSFTSGKSRGLPGMDAIDQAVQMKQDLLTEVERVGELLPANTLDELIDELGGPDNVAEMTGRKGRVVSTNDGAVQYESRSETDVPLEILNLTEKQRFMDGEKNIAIISEAASSGISLQADRRAINQRRRVHITLELPWSADRAVQQFGRTHRSNQVSAPEYVFLISELAGEQRFASTVAKRLQSLGALTHGDRRAGEARDLSRFNIDNKYGRAALEAVMKSVLGYEAPMAPLPKDYEGNFLQDVKTALVGVGMITCDENIGVPVLEKDYNNISKFLNRILGTEVQLQNALFKYFTDTLATVILQAKRNGNWDLGILDLGQTGEKVKTLKTKTFSGNFSGTTTKITLYTVSVERGLTWQKAMEIWRDHDGSEDGFYLSNQTRNNRCPAILAVAMVGKKKDRLYRVYRPNTGFGGRMETMAEIKKKYKKVYPDDARYHWEDQFDCSETMCTHAFWRGSCRRAALGLGCGVGLRCRIYHVLGGSVLSVWTKVESVLAATPGGMQSRMQIIRLRTDDGRKVVGTLIPDSALPRLDALLTQEGARSHDKVLYDANPVAAILPRASSPYVSSSLPQPGAHRPASPMSSLISMLPRSSPSLLSMSPQPPYQRPPSQPPPPPSQPQPKSDPSSGYLNMPMFL